MPKINVSSAPAKNAATYINQKLQASAGKAVTLFLSGGSSLKVLSYINLELLSSTTTVVMGDERFTKVSEGSNYIQLTETSFFKSLQKRGVNFINTAVGETEDLTSFTQRLNDEYQKIKTDRGEQYQIGLFGIGHDCHTASIFPQDTEKAFKELYLDAPAQYISVIEPTNEFPERVTITPAFIDTELDDIIVYAAGKQEMLLTLQFAQHEYMCPALTLLKHSKAQLFTDAEIARL